MWFTKIWQIAQNASLVCLVDQGKLCSNFIVSIKMSTNNFIAFEVSFTFFLQQVKHFACQPLAVLVADGSSAKTARHTTGGLPKSLKSVNSGRKLKLKMASIILHINKIR